MSSPAGTESSEEDHEWDDENIRHVARHGVRPDEAESVLEDDTVEISYEVRNGEERYTEVGMTKAGRFLAVVSTIRGSRIRVVTAYDAPNLMIDKYFHRERHL